MYTFGKEFKRIDWIYSEYANSTYTNLHEFFERCKYRIFPSSVSDTGFVLPVSLKDGLALSFRYEFLEDNSSKKTFDTE